MQVVGHEAIGRTNKTLASRSVKDKFAEGGVKTIVEPALFAMGDRHAPEDDGVGLIEDARQAWEVEGPVSVGRVHGLLSSSRREEAQTLFLWERKLEPPYVGCYQEVVGKRSLSLVTSAATTWLRARLGAPCLFLRRRRLFA
jgi:hypothetical protein